MKKERIKKLLFWALMVSLIGGTWQAGRVSLGCDFKSGLIWCGTKSARQNGCYVEVKGD